MKFLRWAPLCASLLLSAGLILQAAKPDTWTVLTGDKAWADTNDLKPGISRRITASDLPAPSAPGRGAPKATKRPEGAMPIAPAGFTVNIYAETGTNAPRQIRVAPNGDIFVANSSQNNVVVYRGIGRDGKAVQTETYATGLTQPFGINFFPAGDNPQWVYVANTGSVVRFPYKKGDLKASGPAETLIADISPGGNHWTRDIVFRDGNLLVSVGSNSNIDDPDTKQIERNRARILEFTPDGKPVGVYASGIRNPVGLAVNPITNDVWTSINERDMLGDNLVPDYVTSVKKGGFYGWPYFYIGGHPDERLKGAHAELKGSVIVPDVLIQPHSASLGMTFYSGTMFPAEYRGDAFAAEHGSWNRSKKAGHEVIRIPLDNGKASGVYQDFLTGFIDEQGQPWGTPVGVATAPDGSLLVTDDGARVIWRVSSAAAPAGAKGKAKAK